MAIRDVPKREQVLNWMRSLGRETEATLRMWTLVFTQKTTFAALGQAAQAELDRRARLEA